MSLYPNYLQEQRFRKFCRTYDGVSEIYHDSGIRWTPDGFNYPESLGIQMSNPIPIYELSMLQRTFGNPVTISNQVSLTTLNLPQFTASASSFTVSGNSALTTVYAPHIALPTYGTTLQHGFAVLSFASNALSSATVDALIVSLAASFVSGINYNLEVSLSGGTNQAPTSASAAALAILQTSGAGITVSHT